jgi:hypothetical protein
MLSIKCNLWLNIATATSLTDIRGHSGLWCSRRHHRCTRYRCKAWRRWWRVSLCRVEHGHPTRRRGLCHARWHTHTYGRHWDTNRHRPWSLHLRLHGHCRKSSRWGRRRGQSTSELALVRARKARHGLRSAVSRCGRTRCKWERVVLPGLRRQQSFGGCAVTLALSVLFERVLDRDGLVHEELPIHRLDGRVGGFEVRVGHEPVTLRQP